MPNPRYVVVFSRLKCLYFRGKFKASLIYSDWKRKLHPVLPSTPLSSQCNLFERQLRKMASWSYRCTYLRRMSILDGVKFGWAEPRFACISPRCKESVYSKIKTECRINKFYSEWNYNRSMLTSCCLAVNIYINIYIYINVQPSTFPKKVRELFTIL